MRGWKDEKYRGLQGTFPVISLSLANVKETDFKSAGRFYHGFVLGLLVELQGKYQLRSNRESGFSRYDILLEPIDNMEDGIIIEFKVRKPRYEESLQDTVAAALLQNEEKHYEQELLLRGIARERIHKYGFAFEGKKVLIGGG